MKKLSIFLVLLVSTFTLASCNLTNTGGSSDSMIQTQVALNVAMTQLANTQTALAQGAVVQTQAPPPAEPTATMTLTQEVILETPTLTLTPEPLFTPTAEGVWLSVSQNTNCRSGPGGIYELMGTVNQGQRVQAVARNPWDDYYLVNVPTIYGQKCWLWNRYATIEGDIQVLPVYTPQPTPTVNATATNTTAPAGFTVSFLDVQVNGPLYGIQLYITNTGNLIWRSVKVVLRDNTNSLTSTHTSDTFRGTDGGVIDVANEQGDLVYGEGSRVACVNPGQLNYNPAGRSFTATVTLYANDGLTGTSQTQTITFTP